MSNQHTRSSYLPEIDGLRAIAVGLIILFHLNRTVEFGYIGVDLFFVISGFVVTRSIMGTQNAEMKEVLEFYLRRIKRIFPALALAFVIGSLVSLYTTNAVEIKDVQKVGVFGLFGLANWRLMWSAQDYFGAAVEYNPFTHLWSLGVEEQFYILVAPIILLLPALRIKIVALICLVSLIAFIGFNSDLLFYATTHRLWQLGTGVLLALNYHRLNISNLELPFAVLGILLILIAAFVGFQPEILTVAGTALCIMSVKKNDHLPAKLLAGSMSVWIGKLSYSLYLFHWPVFVFFRLTYGLEEIEFQLIAILLTFLFAISSYYLAEKPLRYASWGGKQPQLQFVLAFTLAITTAILLTRISNEFPKIARNISGSNGTPIMLRGQPSLNDWAGQGRDCRKDYEGITEAQLFEKCLKRISDRQHLFLIGDSHATQLKFAFEKITGTENAINAEFRYAVNNHMKEVPLQGVIGNELKYLLGQVRKEDIVFIAIARGKFYENELQPIDPDQDPMGNKGTRKRVENYARALSDFARKLDQVGTRLVLVESGPKLIIPADAKICFARLRLTSTDICQTTVELSLHNRKPMSEAITRVLNATTNTSVFDFHNEVCPGGTCNIFHEKELFMVDGNHISKHFSEHYVGPMLIKFLKEQKYVDQAGGL